MNLCAKSHKILSRLHSGEMRCKHEFFVLFLNVPSTLWLGMGIGNTRAGTCYVPYRDHWTLGSCMMTRRALHLSLGHYNLFAAAVATHVHSITLKSSFTQKYTPRTSLSAGCQPTAFAGNLIT